ncbi:MAG: DUF5671 domain-containing protein [Candidatus Kerfeldbacteria bacterium]
MEQQTKKESSVSPKDVFMHFLAMVMLYAAAISFLVIVFQVVNIQFPDILEQGGYDYYQLENSFNLVRGALAFIIITFPVFIAGTWMLKKSYDKEPEKRRLAIRKWLVYFTLFVAALIIVGNLIALVAGFLYGELTLRFILKIVSVFFVAGCTFGYYIYDLKDKHAKGLRILAIVVSAIVLASIIIGFFYIGSPWTMRERRIDEQRIQNLQMIENNIQYYFDQNDKLPQTMEQIPKQTYEFISTTDPITGKEYTYEVTSELTFKLCAEFSLPSYAVEYGRVDLTKAMPENSWEHTSGTTCFAHTIYDTRNEKDPVEVMR